MLNRLSKLPLDGNRMRREWQKLANSKLAVAVGINNSVGAVITGVAEQSVSAGHLIPKDSLTLGKLITVHWMGKFSTVGTTLRLKLYANATVLIDTGNMTLAALAAKAVHFKANLHVTATGAAGSITAFLESAKADTIEVSLAGAAVAIDTTIGQTITLKVIWGTADAGNTIQEQIFGVHDAG